MQHPVDSVIQVSEDWYWKFVEGSWIPTELQLNALAQGALPHDSNPAIPVNQASGLVTIYTHADSEKKPVTFVIGISMLGVILLIVLSGVLYTWASSLAEEDILGTWHNPEQTLRFDSDGTMTDSEGTWNDWRVDGNRLYLVSADEPDMEYYFQYSISNEVLFIAPLDDDYSVMSDSCSTFATKGVVWEDAEYSSWPSWCADEWL